MVHDQRIQRGAASFSRCKAEGGRGGWSVGGLGAVLFLLAALVLPSSGVGGAARGVVENPGANSYQSGLGLISGWVCDADLVEIEIGDFLPQAAAYGTERLDTAGVCGDTDNGFGLLFNWNLLGAGEHTVRVLADGEEVGQATFTVTTLGAEFLWGAEGECVVEDFPAMGRTVTLEWQQTSQNFVIAGGSAPARAHTGTRPSGLTGYLENPGPNSFQSGIGVISGWVCEAEAVELEIGTTGRQAAAYGTERLDTRKSMWGHGQRLWVVVQLESVGRRRACGGGMGGWDGVRPGHGAGDDAGGGVSAGSRGGVYGRGLPEYGTDRDLGMATDQSELRDCRV